MKRTVIMILLILITLPALGNIIIIGDLTHSREAKAGEEYSGSIEISNIGDEPKQVKLYQTDYQFFSDGRILYGDPGKTLRSNAMWITFSPKRITVPGNESVSVIYTVQVPANVKLQGSYWSIIMVEELDEASPEADDSEETEVGVQQAFRYGLQMVTHVGTEGTKNLKFTGAQLFKNEKGKGLILDVENTGELWVKAHLWAELYDSKGKMTGKYEAGTLRIYPGTSVRFTVNLSESPAGKYKSLIIVDCGSNDVFGANYNLVLE